MLVSQQVTRSPGSPPNILSSIASLCRISCLHDKILLYVVNKAMIVIFYLHDVVVWTGMAPIGSFIWMLPHQWVTLLRRFRGVALLGEVCHWGRALRFQMLKTGPVSLSSCSLVQTMSALVFISHFPEFSTFTKSEDIWHIQNVNKPLSSSTFSRSMWLILANGLSPVGRDS